METFVEFCGMTEATLALVIMIGVGIASLFTKKSDIEKLKQKETA